MKESKCRFCSQELKENFADLGNSPLSNSFLKEMNMSKEEKFYPLHAYVCSNCFLVQLGEFQSPSSIFSDYAYFSSYSKTWLKHAEDYVEMMIRRFNFDLKSQIIEIASNDGYLLQYFIKKKIPAFGIEPAENVAKIANQNGIPTIIKFFGVKTAKEFINEGTRADLLLGNNVLAHVPDLNDFISGLKILLRHEGIITMEFPHILKLIQNNQFDTIYHEHFSYFSLLTVQKIFSFHNLTIFDVDELSTHGGSLRIYVKHEDDKTKPENKNVDDLIKEEKQFGLDKISTYTNFQRQIEILKQDIQRFFSNIKSQGKTIVGYGAPAKGNTLLNFCGIDKNFLDYTVDKNPYKQGLYLPGTHILIEKPEKIQETRPDYIFILPWNLNDEIIEEIGYISNWGGKFVIPIPKIVIQ